jgi:hypothetical protein
MIALVLSTAIVLAQPVVAQNAAPAAAATAAPVQPSDSKVTEQVRTEFKAWQTGKIDRTHYSSEANATFTDDAIAQIAEHLKPLGDIKSMLFTGSTTRLQNNVYNYRVVCEKGDVKVQLALDRTGKVSGISFRPADKPPAGNPTS